MEKKLSEILEKINNKLEYYAVYQEYMPEEREALSEIIGNNTFLTIDYGVNFIMSELLESAIIIGGKYSDINSELENIKTLKKTIDILPYNTLCYIVKTVNELNSSHSLDEILDQFGIEYKNIKNRIKSMDINDLFPDINAKKVQNNLTDLIRLFVLADNQILEVMPYIKQIMMGKEVMFDTQIIDGVDMSKDRDAIDFFNKQLKGCFDINSIKKQLMRINSYYLELEKENKRRMTAQRKEANRLLSLKKNLVDTKDKKEITNLNTIFSLLSDDLEEDVLRYIALKNNKYYLSLEREYEYISKNSLIVYLELFNKRGINFNTYSKKIQQALLNIGKDKIEEIFEFLDSINYSINKTVAKIVLNTNTDIIKDINQKIKNGSLTSNFVCNHIAILLTNEDGLYQRMNANIKILTDYGINLLNISEGTMSLFLIDPYLLIDNLKIIDSYSINIKNKNFDNYTFLANDNLEQKLIGLEKLNIDNCFYPILLNADTNILKRIEICQSINIDIYDELGLKPEILNPDMFFIKDSNLDKYIDSKNYIKTFDKNNCKM